MRRGFLALMATVGLGLFAGAAQADWRHDGRHGGGHGGHHNHRGHHNHGHNHRHYGSHHGHHVQRHYQSGPVIYYRRAYTPPVYVQPYGYYPYPESNFGISTPRFSFSISH